MEIKISTVEHLGISAKDYSNVLKLNTCFVFFNRCVAIMASLAFTA